MHHSSVVDQGEGPREGLKKIFFWDHPLPTLSQGLDDWAPPYLKVSIRHCSLSAKVTSSYLSPQRDK